MEARFKTWCDLINAHGLMRIVRPSASEGAGYQRLSTPQGSGLRDVINSHRIMTGGFKICDQLPSPDEVAG